MGDETPRHRLAPFEIPLFCIERKRSSSWIARISRLLVSPRDDYVRRAGDVQRGKICQCKKTRASQRLDNQWAGLGSCREASGGVSGSAAQCGACLRGQHPPTSLRAASPAGAARGCHRRRRRKGLVQAWDQCAVNAVPGLGPLLPSWPAERDADRPRPSSARAGCAPLIDRAHARGDLEDEAPAHAVVRLR